ncbi:MAG: alpha/beta hydrolase [Dehalococcoidales bacterium]|nr:alpha/beta hydrolase [Dehalococcoidales bacterium]
MPADKQPSDKFVNVNGLNLHYLDWGGSSQKPLVLLHGLTSNAHSWDFFAQEMCQDFHVYALDQRGHGDSEHAKNGYWITLFTSDLYEFTKALGITFFDLCGLSLGARNGMAYAGEHPETLNHLVLVDFGPEMAVQGAKRVMASSGTPPMGFRNKEEAIEYFRQRNPRAKPEYLDNQVENSLRLNWAGMLVFKHDRELFWISGSAGKKEVPYLWKQLPMITCPTLIVRGMESDVLSPEVAQKMLSLIPKSQLIEIPDSGHPVPTDNPEAFEKGVRQFLLG